MKTKEEILEQVSGLSIDFIKEHHDTIPLKEYLEAMEIYAQQQVKNLNIPAVMGELTCDNCGCHPSIIYKTPQGTFCQLHAKY